MTNKTLINENQLVFLCLTHLYLSINNNDRYTPPKQCDQILRSFLKQKLKNARYKECKNFIRKMINLDGHTALQSHLEDKMLLIQTELGDTSEQQSLLNSIIKIANFFGFTTASLESEDLQDSLDESQTYTFLLSQNEVDNAFKDSKMIAPISISVFHHRPEIIIAKYKQELGEHFYLDFFHVKKTNRLEILICPEGINKHDPHEFLNTRQKKYGDDASKFSRQLQKLHDELHVTSNIFYPFQSASIPKLCDGEFYIHYKSFSESFKEGEQTLPIYGIYKWRNETDKRTTTKFLSKSNLFYVEHKELSDKTMIFLFNPEYYRKHPHMLPDSRWNLT